MNAEALQLILDNSKPCLVEVDKRKYFDADMTLVTPPMAAAVELTSLEGLADYCEDVCEAAEGETFIHVKSATHVELLSQEPDEFGRRRVWATAIFPSSIKSFSFGSWLNVENFIIEVQQYFQRVRIESDNGEMAKDLDYILKIASNIEGGVTRTNKDDGISQVVNVKQGIALKTEETLRPRVNLAPFRTFAEIDQPIGQFIFRARESNDVTQLALFEGDGGRWRLAAVRAIAAFLYARKLKPVVT